MNLSQTLKDKRKESQLTQEQLAEKLFVSTKTISNWETGKTTPDIDSLIRLANLFHLSLDGLLLEGSDVVENIKKIEAAKIAKKYFAISWMTNIMFCLIFITSRYYGGLPTMLFSLITIAMVLNVLVLLYFTRQVGLTNDGQTPYQVLKNNTRDYY